MIELTLKLDIVSPNAAGHWAKAHFRNKQNARIIGSHWLTLPNPKPKPPCKIYLERIWCKKDKGKAMDYGNLVGALKGVQDSIAALVNPGAVLYYIRKGKRVKNPGRADDECDGIEFFYEQTESDFSAIKIKFFEVEPCLSSNVANVTTK